MANKIDTGTGGFPTGEKDNLTTYDVGVVQDEPPLPAVPWSAGDIVAQGEQGSSDISKNTKKTLAQYLSDLTLGKINGSTQVKNVYPVDAPSDENKNIKLVDEKGFPVSATAGQANPANKSHFAGNLQSSYTADLIAATTAGTDPFKIKRGLASGTAPDGNTLLFNAGVGGVLQAPLKTYTAEILKHNLNNPLSPDPTPLVNVIIGDGGLVQAENIRNLTHTTDFSTDGGTSKNILHPDAAHIKTIEEAAGEAHIITANSSPPNAYPVDKIGDKLGIIFLADTSGYPVSPTNSQANPANSSHFTDSLQTSYTDDLIASNKAEVSPFQIKRGLGPGTNPDGNTLLPAAAPGGILSAPLNSYTAEILKHNLNNQLDPLKKLDNVVIGDGGLVQADKIRPLTHTTDFSTDGGTSKNILHPDAAHNLSLKDSVDHLEADTGKGTSVFIGTGININYYPVSQDNETNLNLRTGGIPTPITATKNKSKFVDTTSGSPQETLRSVGYIEAYNLIKDEFHKGRSTTKLSEDGKDRNGNTILDVSPIQSPVDISQGRSKGNIDPAHPVAKYSTALLNSRFNIDHQYENMSIADTNSTFYAQQFAQKYPLGRSLAENEPRNITFGKLAQVGPALSLRSGLEMTDLANPTGNVSEAEALLPGINQTGIERIERSRLEAGNVLTELLQHGLKDADPKSVIINPAALSYGSLNNVFDQFSGISNFGMQILAITLILALSIIMVAVFGLFSIMSKNRSIGDRFNDKGKMIPHVGGPEDLGYDTIGRRTIGSYLGRGSSSDLGSAAGIIRAMAAGEFNIWQLIGIQPTRNELQKCAIAGAFTFFGIDYGEVTDKGLASGGKPGSTALSALGAGAQNPGYDSIMARSVSRSFLSISDALMGFKGTTVTGGLKKTLGLIEVLRDSKFMRALNIFSQLGDQVLTGIIDNNADATATGGFGKKISKMDTGGYDPNLAVQRNNRLNGSLTLAWAAYRSPDLFIYPAGYTAAIAIANNLDGAPSTLPRPDKNRDTEFFAGGEDTATSAPGSSRISTEYREAFETKLDAEYMPFYFHDVRTNEFVSFHAFLASLTDAYTAAYDAVDAFGRVEQIKTYKNTSRKIGFSFYIAATNEEDFKIMWSKINKLVTLVYPQFTEGKEVFSDDGKYRLSMPFSQQIGAAPMTRIRIGDLVQSNYSKFNLARLFGATYPNNTINESKLGADATTGTKFNQRKFEKDVALAIDVLRGESGNTFTPAGDVHNIRPDGASVYSNSDFPWIGSSITLADLGDVSLVSDKLPNTYTLVLNKAEDLREMSVLKKNVITKAKFTIPKVNANPTQATIEKAKNAVMSTPAYANADGKYFANLNEFMYDGSDDANKGNIIAKSFRSSGGRGLGGFIDTMSFDWFDKVTWAGLGTSAPTGLRAPKICKVTIAFSPIHDITPGLDHLGSNRAPIYPVGYLAPVPKQGKNNGF